MRTMKAFLATCLLAAVTTPALADEDGLLAPDGSEIPSDRPALPLPPPSSTPSAPTAQPTAPAPAPAPVAPAPAPAPPVANDSVGTPEATAAPTPSGQLPPAQSDNDPAPPVPTPVVPGVSGDVVEQAGVGGTVGYARAGVLELGGSAGLVMANDIRALNISPSIGWFLVDNFQLSGILDVANVKAAEGDDATVWSALIEPSIHLPFNRSMFGFVGTGIGASYVSGVGTGMAVAPRIGMEFLVGRSGILRPSLSYQYTTHDANVGGDPEEGTGNLTVVAVSSALRFNVGYSTMW